MLTLRLLARVDVSVVFGLLLVGLYLYGTWSSNRAGARARRLDELRGRILTHVKKQPGAEPVGLEDLHKAGVVSDEELQILQEGDATYHPISAQSPDDALFFVVRRGRSESRYYKGGRMDYVSTWPSPDGSYAVVSLPDPERRPFRMIQLLEQATGRILATRPTTGDGVLSNEAVWNSDGSRVAVNVPARPKKVLGNFSECFLFERTADVARIIELPGELQPEQRLDAADRGQGVRWHEHWVRATGWQANDRLLVETEGRGRIGDPIEGPSFNLIDRFELLVDEGRAAIAKAARRHFARTERK